MKHSHLGPADSSAQTEAVAARIRALGLAGAAAALLDALAPLAPLSAQALYVAQPLAGLASASWSSAAGELAAELERPGGAAALRTALLADTGPQSG